MDRKNYNDDGSSTGGLSETDRNGMNEIQDHISNRSTTIMRSTHKSERQVLMLYTKADNRGL